MGASTSKIKPVSGMCFSLDSKMYICTSSRDPQLYCPDTADFKSWEDVKDKVVLLDHPSTTAGVLDNVRRLSGDKFAFVIPDYEVGPVTKIIWKCLAKGMTFTAETEGRAVFLAFKELVNDRKEDEVA